MPTINETELKKQISAGELAPVYLLYGEEGYLKKHYSRRIVDKAVDKGDSFNFHQFTYKDTALDDVLAAAEMLPVMAQRRCVLLLDLDVESLKAGDKEKLDQWLKDPPDTCVLVIRLDAVEANPKRSAKWRAFLKKVDDVGCSVPLDHRDSTALSKLLCAAAVKRSCQMSPHTAGYLVQLCGTDLEVLYNELEKACSLVGSGEITRKEIDAVAVPTLESTVFDLTRAITRKDRAKAFLILGTLLDQKEEPVSILSVLCMSYVDLYRAKVASLSGGRAEDLTVDFDYRGKEFRLRNAARDASRLDLDGLRKDLDLLSEADRMLKGSKVDARIVLEQTLVQLMT